MLVKAVVAELTVKAFYKGILSWFPRLDEVQLNAGFSAPEEHSFRRTAGGGMVVAKTQTLAGQLIQVRRADLTTVGAYVAITEVIGEDEQDVRAVVLLALCVK